MKDLQNITLILQEFGSKQPFRKDNGKLTTSGAKAYDKLTSVVELLGEMNIIEDAAEAIETLDYVVEPVPEELF